MVAASNRVIPARAEYEESSSRDLARQIHQAEVIDRALPEGLPDVPGGNEFHFDDAGATPSPGTSELRQRVGSQFHTGNRPDHIAHRDFTIKERHEQLATGVDRPGRAHDLGDPRPMNASCCSWGVNPLKVSLKRTGSLVTKSKCLFPVEVGKVRRDQIFAVARQDRERLGGLLDQSPDQ